MLRRAEDGGIKRSKIANHRTNCLKTNNVFTAADRAQYGDFQPAICGPRDIRLSRSEILYALLTDKRSKCFIVRWVVNPWFVGIQPNHKTTDIMESSSWSIVSRYNKDFTVSPNTASGQINIHESHVQRFPASVLLRNISHLSDALIGQA